MRVIQKINEAVLKKTVERCSQRQIAIPTLAEQKDPSLVPEPIKRRLASVGLWDVNPLNLYRITWKNEPKDEGGLYNRGNWLEFPPELTGVKARIVGLVGKYFPTGAHKVGAAFGCLVPRLVSGEFDPETQKAAWPSTGNFCRGGAFDSSLLACKAIAILPEEMSKERFDWLREINTDEIIATPGSESNVKEIFDACWEIKKTQPDAVVFNQFEEFGNYLWHFGVTGPAAGEAFRALAGPRSRLAAWVGATGSAGTLAAGDYLGGAFPGCTITAAEALQCPTLLSCGFGAHRIEGIGDKHVPFIHNVRNTDVVTAIDDEAAMRVFRLCNEPAGHTVLQRYGLASSVVSRLGLLGISGVCNLLAAIKTARHFEMDSDDVLLTCFTDSSALYRSRLAELNAAHGPYTELQAQVDLERYLLATTTDHMAELCFGDRKRIHNLKYFTWVEQQGRSVSELNALWSPSFWSDLQGRLPEWDRQIEAFNTESGVLATLKRGV
jgi:cysteine synthase A